MGALGYARLLLLALIWAAGLGGRPTEVAILLVVVALTHVVDWLPNPATAGDSLTDKLLVVSMAAVLFLLRPRSLEENVWITAACLWLFAASVIAGLVRYRRLPLLRLYSSKPAGIALYVFAVQALLAPPTMGWLFYVAAGLFALSSLESLLVQLTGRIDQPATVPIRRRVAP